MRKSDISGRIGAARARIERMRADAAVQKEQARAEALERNDLRLGRDELVYLVAPAGHPNYGDELIARTWLRNLAKVRPNATVVVDCHTPGQAALLFRGDHPRAVFTDTLWQLTIYADRELGADGPLAPWEWVADAATNLGRAPRLAEGVDLLAQASSIHLLGGGYLNDIWPSQVSLVTAVAAVAQKSGARAFATGHGLVPLLRGARRDAFLDAADAFEVFDVRDDASAAGIGGVRGARATGDDVWLGVPQVSAPSGAPSGGVVLCLQGDLIDDFRYGEDAAAPALTAFVRDTLDAWDVAGEEVTVVEGIPGRDFEIADRLGERLAGATVMPFLDVWRAGLPVGAGKTWISTRFHPHLVAAAAGDSGVAVIPRPDYYATKHDSLVAAGSQWTVVGGGGWSADSASIPERPTAGGFPPAARDRAVIRKAELARELYPPLGSV